MLDAVDIRREKERRIGVGFCVLDGSAVYGAVPFVWRVLWAGWGFMTKKMESFVDAPWHGHINISFVVVPCQVEGVRHVGYLILLAQCMLEVVDIRNIGILDARVIGD